jgi:outer membrane immunogenic protein
MGAIMKTVLGGLALSVLLAAPVMAADMRMPVKAPPAPVVTLYSWTGCYIGGHVGYAWGQTRVYNADNVLGGAEVSRFRHDADGLVAGGQIGCNLWQSDRWVFGIEGQASWADVDGETPLSSAIPGGPGTTGFRTEIDMLGSIAARFGYAFGATGQTLVFVKGGAAFVHEQYFIVSPFPGLAFESDENLRWGWMVGAGFEQTLGSNWSFKAEYNYNHFGRDAHELCSTITTTCGSFEIKQHIHLVKVGINYRFGGFGGPVVARY